MADLNRLWAPWRREYIFGRAKRRCIFCFAHRSREDNKQLVIARGAKVFAILNRYPYNNGHFMIAPYRHIGNFTLLTQTEWSDMLRMGQKIVSRIYCKLKPHGFNMGINIEKAAGAGVAGHLHMHFVPRWTGDTNFMPVFAGTRVVSQSLDELYRLLTKS